MIRLVLALATVLLVLVAPRPATADPKEDVAATTQAWIDAMNSRDPDRVVALYDPEAVLWGTVSPTIRETPEAIRDYYQTLPTLPPEFRGTLVDQHVRVYGDTAINSGTYTFATVVDGRHATVQTRFTFVYRQRDGRWLIVEHHASAMPAPPQ
jgi:uncharacterized protein (TIGR02246 family)